MSAKIDISRKPLQQEDRTIEIRKNEREVHDRAGLRMYMRSGRLVTTIYELTSDEAVSLANLLLRIATESQKEFSPSISKYGPDECCQGGARSYGCCHGCQMR